VSIPGVLITRSKARVMQTQPVPFDRRDDEQGMTMDMRFAIKFEPPAEATPMTLSGAALTLDMRTPGRVVKVFALPQGETGEQQLVATLDNLSQPVTIPLEKLAGLEVARGGGVILVVAVLPPEGVDQGDPASLKTWRIRDVRVSLKGTVHE
jgi:hypothetical protein